MSKITNDGLTQSGAGCFIAVPIWQQLASKATLSVAHCQSVRLPRATSLLSEEEEVLEGSNLDDRQTDDTFNLWVIRSLM